MTRGCMNIGQNDKQVQIGGPRISTALLQFTAKLRCQRIK